MGINGHIAMMVGFWLFFFSFGHVLIWYLEWIGFSVLVFDKNTHCTFFVFVSDSGVTVFFENYRLT